MPNYKQVEMMPLPHGGKRENAGRKPLDKEKKRPKTTMIRVDERLVDVIKQLKQEIAKENHEMILKVAEMLRNTK